ncbi:hypothetical protein [Roseofilum casamattae]|nr:hypothetical protein [Roseofilum casamattae]
MNGSRGKQLAIAISSITLCAIAIGGLQLPKLNQLQRERVETSQEQWEQEVTQESVELQLLKTFPNFGFDNLIANWVFIKYLIYFGDDSAREQTGYELIPEYFDINITEDPRFVPAYFYLSASLSLYLGEPEISVAMMQRQLENLSPKDPPGAYYIWRYLGIDQLLFLGDSNAARESFEQAAVWAKEYSDPESEMVRDISQVTARFLAQNPDSKQAQYAAWILVYQNAIDAQVRDRAIAGIRSVGGIVEEMEDGSISIQPPPTD